MGDFIAQLADYAEIIGGVNQTTLFGTLFGTVEGIEQSAIILQFQCVQTAEEFLQDHVTYADEAAGEWAVEES